MHFTQGMELPLKGLKIIDFATVIAAPVTARIFADLGADVIKVENVGGGDYIMRIQTKGTPIIPEEHPLFAYSNSNKRFVSLDLKKPEGYAVMMKLLEDSDVLISNVRYKSLENLHMDYETIHARFPKLIYGHFSGYGYNGPDADIAAFDASAFWGKSGAMKDWVPDGNQLPNASYGFGDFASAMTFFGAIMTALYKRKENGKGTMVAVSLQQNGLWMHNTNVIAAQERYHHSFPEDMDQFMVTSSLFRTKDKKWFMSLVHMRLDWEGFCRAVGMPHLPEDPRFRDLDTVEKLGTMPELHRIMEKRFLEHTREEWLRIFEKAGLISGSVLSSEEAGRDQNAWDNEYLQMVKYMNGAEILMPAIPMQFSEYGVRPIGCSRPVGYNTDEVLKEHGYTEEEITKLRENKAAQ